MFQAPKNLKFKKFHKIKLKNGLTENRFFCPKFGDYGLQAITSGNVNAAQLEAGRLVVRRFSKKQAFLRINVFPYAAVTKKPTSARMGKGKGKPAGWVCPVKRGRIMYEISSIAGKFKNHLPFFAFRLVNRKLPLKTKATRLIY
jgi:large subunit ribosomal protein L16